MVSALVIIIVILFMLWTAYRLQSLLGLGRCSSCGLRCWDVHVNDEGQVLCRGCYYKTQNKKISS